MIIGTLYIRGCSLVVNRFVYGFVGTFPPTFMIGVECFEYR